jgi:hypothetical protein
LGKSDAREGSKRILAEDDDENFDVDSNVEEGAFDGD